MAEPTPERVSAIRSKLFPIQKGDPVSWEAAEQAYATYARLFGKGQSLERLAERGGFALCEFACLHQGHEPNQRWDMREFNPHLICLQRAYSRAGGRADG